jgi:polysaccharide pyruvyl transferase WcaK-like protein
MKSSNLVRKICVFAINVGNFNLGDEATFAVVLENIKHNYNNPQIYGLTDAPDDTMRRYQIPAFPIRGIKAGVKSEKTTGKNKTRAIGVESSQHLTDKTKTVLKKFPPIFLTLKVLYTSILRIIHLFPDLLREVRFCIKSYRYLKGTDLFMIAGSGVLSDHFGGVLNFPYSAFKWSLLAKLVGAKIAFLSVGAGPINSIMSRYLLKYALLLGDYRSFRDNNSRKLIESIGVLGENQVFPDLVQGLRISSARQTTAREITRYVVGINPFPHLDPRFWPTPDTEGYHRYIMKLASFASWLIQNDYRVLLFPTQLRADPLVISDIGDVLIKKFRACSSEAKLVMPISGLDDLMKQISVMDLVVATRFHGIMLSFLMNKPVIGISNHPKMDSLMRDMGQGKYLLDIDYFDVETLKERFISLRSNSDLIKRNLQPIIEDYRRNLDIQYKNVFSLLNGRSVKEQHKNSLTAMS